MPIMPIDVGKALDVMRRALDMAGQPQQIRSDLIRQATEMCTAMGLASGFTAGRLNKVLAEPSRDQKLRIIGELVQGGDIENFSRVNALCGDIYASSNALRSWWTGQGAAVNARNRQQAQELFDRLTRGEGGMQELFIELLRGASDLGSADEAAIDAWAREKIDQMCQLTEASWATVRELTKTI